MTSSFGWLDHSEQQRRQMLEIVNLFREKGTLDELGVGTIRDAFADRFFPGTSTLHTRGRYLLFVPWIFTALERKRVPSARFDERARGSQSNLVGSLTNGGESEGVIGIAAKNNIISPPSTIYWSALRAFGILRYPYSYASYVRALDRHYRDERGALHSDDGELVEAGAQIWHGGLPEAPSGLFESVDFDFTRAEADYVRERIITQQSGSLMAEFITDTGRVATVALPWEHPACASLPAHMRLELDHAERFSLLSEGVYLLYNVMLAEAAVAAGMTAREGLPERYRESLGRWSDEMTADADLFDGWEVANLWESLATFGRGVPLKTRRFIERWAAVAMADRHGLADDSVARRLVTDRERELKRSLARLQNRRALENWGGASSIGRLEYRWSNARQIIVDIKAGLRRSSADTVDA